MITEPLSIERLLAAPEQADRVPASDIPTLLARLASLQLRVAGLEAALLARLSATIGTAAAEADVLLDMETVASRLQIPAAYGVRARATPRTPDRAPRPTRARSRVEPARVHARA